MSAFLPLLLKMAGAVQLIMAAGGFLLPRRLEFRKGLAQAPLILRQIFLIHHATIMLVLVGFAALCLVFTRDLAGASLLGRCLAGFIALFWGLRLLVQLLYYDPELRRRNRLEDVGFLAAFTFLTLVTGWAALTGGGG